MVWDFVSPELCQDVLEMVRRFLIYFVDEVRDPFIPFAGRERFPEEFRVDYDGGCRFACGRLSVLVEFPPFGLGGGDVVKFFTEYSNK